MQIKMKAIFARGVVWGALVGALLFVLIYFSFLGGGSGVGIVKVEGFPHAVAICGWGPESLATYTQGEEGWELEQYSTFYMMINSEGRGRPEVDILREKARIFCQEY